MYSRLRAWLQARQDAAAIAEWDDRTLTDLGLSRDEALMLARLTGDGEARLRAMAAVFGVDADAVAADPLLWREVAETCAACRQTAQCRRTLERARVLDGSVGAADCGFCPNAPTWQALSA
ncbi:MAG: DUF1127 domain-containing protein [Paracoccaceae bacterium]|nr:MAG: DUF1127 domain-containing protein [Paracoccaceae bacterium]